MAWRLALAAVGLGLRRRRIGDIACAGAGCWVVAVGIMTVALPR